MYLTPGAFMMVTVLEMTGVESPNSRLTGRMGGTCKRSTWSVLSIPGPLVRDDRKIRSSSYYDFRSIIRSNAYVKSPVELFSFFHLNLSFSTCIKLDCNFIDIFHVSQIKIGSFKEKSSHIENNFM
uniref:Uncharacterized protein n=1 Tax=Cacopsylla melanoneura TaxID=428564 RepID=A0A8D8YIU4_9HEMI